MADGVMSASTPVAPLYTRDYRLILFISTLRRAYLEGKAIRSWNKQLRTVFTIQEEPATENIVSGEDNFYRRLYI